MEIGKSHQAGEMGQEAVGALSLPQLLNTGATSTVGQKTQNFSGETTHLDSLEHSSKAAIESFSIFRSTSGRFSSLIETALVLIMGCAAGMGSRVLSHFAAWGNNEFLLDCFNGVMVLFLLHLVNRVRFGKGKEFLELERGNFEATFSTEAMEFWSGSGVSEDNQKRSLALTLRFLAGWTLLMFCLFSESLAPRLVSLVGLIILGVDTFRTFRPGTRSLLLANDKTVSIQGRSISWEEVSYVQVKHSFDIHGGFQAVNLIFRNPSGRKIAQVSLPEERCPISAENALLKFIAGVLGGEVKTIAPRGRI